MTDNKNFQISWFQGSADAMGVFDKRVVEPFALGVIRDCFQARYDDYKHCENEDDFDYESGDKKSFLEITLVACKAFQLQVAFSKEKEKNPSWVPHKRIKECINEDLGLFHEYGDGVLSRNLLKSVIEKKGKKARTHLFNRPYEKVELAIVLPLNPFSIKEDGFAEVVHSRWFLDSCFAHVFLIDSERTIVLDKSNEVIQSIKRRSRTA